MSKPRTGANRRRPAKTTHSVRSFADAYDDAIADLRKPGLQIELRVPDGAGAPSPQEIERAWAPTLDHLHRHIQHTGKLARRRLDDLPCLQVLATLVASISFHDPESYREADSRHSAMHVDFAAWHYLTADPTPTQVADVLESEPMQEVFDLLDELAAATQSYYTIKSQIASLSYTTAVDDLLYRARSWHTFVRSPSYEHHNRAQLRALLSPFDAELRDLIGLTVDDVIRAEEVITSIVNKRFGFVMAEVANTVNALNDQLRRDPDKVDSDYAAIVDRLRREPNPGDGSKAVAMLWAQSTWHEAFIVTPGEVAERDARLPEDVARRVLSLFGISFGQRRRDDDWPTVEEPLERAPLIELGDDAWFVGLISKLQWAIAPRLEDALKSSPHWERYQRHRSRYVEDLAVALVAGEDPKVLRWTRLRYGDDSELDGLVFCGGTAILVETKAGRLRQSARRGAAASAKDDLRLLLTDAQVQLNRATDYLLATEEAKFRTDSGPVVVRREEINRLVHMIVSLDSLTAFVTRLPRLTVAGLFDERTLPWAVDLNDLRVCSEILGSPARLIHYIDRRMRAARRGVEAPEELDFLGHYIRRGLYFDRLDPDVYAVRLTSYSDPIDDFYRHEAGVRKTSTSKPARTLEPRIAALVERFEASAPAGFAEAVFWLLELSPEGQRTVADMIGYCRSRSEDGSAAGARTHLGSVLFVYLAVPDDSLTALDAYLGAAKYQARADWAVGVCESSTSHSSIRVVIRRDPWAEDADVESGARRYLASFTSRNFDETS